MELQLKKATHRDTQAHWVLVGRDVRVLFSYETAVVLEDGAFGYRRRNVWGPTTGRHINEAGARGYPELDEEEFNARLRDALKGALLAEWVSEECGND